MSTNGFSHSIRPATDRAIEYFRSIVPEGQSSPGKATEAYRNVDELAYLLSQVPMGTPRKVKIIASGAGFSGLAIARAVNIGQIPNAELKVYEKNSAPGGTWWENRYPGCACDIPAHNYQFSWAPNPYWKSFYASRDDIQDYFNAVVEQHDLRKYIETSRKIVGAKWLEDRQVWEVTVSKTDGRELVPGSFGATDGETGETFVEECDIFINSSGFFNAWKWPDVPGRETFKGRTLHSAAWPEDGDKDIDGKTVSLIGNGSSGVQLLPAIIKRAKKVYVHIRSPTWITTGIAEQFAGPGGSNLWFSEEQKREWAEQPEKHLAYRKKIEATMNSRFGLYIDHTPAQKAAREFSENEMKKKLSKAGKEGLIKLMMPDFAVGCRRPTPGNGYLEALGEPNCEVVWGDVDCFTPNGLRTHHNGVATETEADTIICATGFDLSMAPRFPVIGRHGVDLRERWLKNPDSYLSVTTSDMPNYFTFMGPSSPLGHGSLVTSIEFVCTYVCDLIKKLQTENYASLCPKPGVSEAYQRHALAWLEKTAWASSCTSTYKNGNKDGKLVSLHPGSRLHYFKLLATHRYEDFDWTSLYEDPDLRFAWMASGFTYDETVRAEEVDLTSFCDPDEHMKPVVPRSQARAEMNGKL